MAIFPNVWRPKPGRFGNAIEVSTVSVGTQGVNFSASSTVTAIIPVPRRRCYIESISINGRVAAVGGGAMTVQVIKRDNTAAADVNITAATSVTNTVITAADVNPAVAITATPQQRVLKAGDTLKIALVAASTITTQPTATVVVELGILE
jgi:hypothetical protein